MSKIDVLDGIQGLSVQISKFLMKPYTIWKPKYSCIKWSVNSCFKGAVISIAESLDKNAKPGDGNARFDHANETVFTLSPMECVKILRNIEAVKKGTYIDPNPKETNETSKHNFKVVHWSDKIPKTLSLMTMKNREGTLLDTIAISIFANSKSYYFPFNPDELFLFTSFIKNVATNLEFIGSCATAFFKTTSQATYDRKEFELKGSNKKPNNQAPSQYAPPQPSSQNVNEPIEYGNVSPEQPPQQSENNGMFDSDLPF